MRKQRYPSRSRSVQERPGRGGEVRSGFCLPGQIMSPIVAPDATTFVETPPVRTRRLAECNPVGASPLPCPRLALRDGVEGICLQFLVRRHSTALGTAPFAGTGASVTEKGRRPDGVAPGKASSADWDVSTKYQRVQDVVWVLCQSGTAWNLERTSRT
jgi:hypothetical protein